jgi:serine/threonine protein kinase
VVQGFAYLHQNSVYMRDLKPENIILDDNLDTKICDFGWASKLDDTDYLKLKGGTYGYMSPENLQGLVQDLRSDLWSLGVLLFELIHNRLPFRQGISCKEQWEFVQEGKIVFKRGLSASIKDTIEGLLRIEPSERLSIEHVSEVELVPTTGETSASSSLINNLFLGIFLNLLQTLLRDLSSNRKQT